MISEYIRDWRHFLVILKRMFQNHQTLLKKCFLGTTCIMLCLICPNVRPHHSMLPVAKGVIKRKLTTTAVPVISGQKSNT